ncbi:MULTISPECIES: hypothetical protein [Stenotrophomonas]|uniref:hypothetical protein n=1 Tax=Stenotrophomonas TaxID=40323 RepID=UPI0012E3D026|nr:MULTISPECIES: hypothetical protein [Stenotrophomonas]
MAHADITAEGVGFLVTLQELLEGREVGVVVDPPAVTTSCCWRTAVLLEAGAIGISATA